MKPLLIHAHMRRIVIKAFQKAWRMNKGPLSDPMGTYSKVGEESLLELRKFLELNQDSQNYSMKVASSWTNDFWGTFGIVYINIIGRGGI